MTKHNNFFILIWAYLSEIILAICIFVLIRFIAPPEFLLKTIFDATGTWTSILCACAGLSFTALITFYAIAQNDFGIWLRLRCSFGIFALAFSFPLVAYLFNIIFLRVLYTYSINTFTLNLCVWLLVYSGVLLITLLINLYEFTVLALEFKKQSQQLRQAENK